MSGIIRWIGKASEIPNSEFAVFLDINTKIKEKINDLKLA